MQCSLDLGRVTDGVDGGVAGAHGLVHTNTAASAQLQAGGLGQATLGPNTDGLVSAAGKEMVYVIQNMLLRRAACCGRAAATLSSDDGERF